MSSNSDKLNKIFDDIINDAENTMRITLKNASKSIQSDIIKKANEDLEYYYLNYTPFIYKRTRKLSRAILPYYSDNSDSKNISIEIGVQYDSSVLTGAYKSNSWYHQSGNNWISRSDDSFNWKGQNNGIPETGWIFNNFMQGIHPVTDKHYKYYEERDPKTQEELMIEFLENELPNKIDEYIMSSIVNIVKSRL